MILIADGGSTKTDWIALNAQKKELFRVTSLGLNPSVIAKEELLHRINNIPQLIDYKHKIEEIHFYGAGCGSPLAIKLLTNVLQTTFKKAKITVSEDMLAAVYACSANKPAIVNILGTGSNSCYYDGYTIQKTAQSLGYTIMDEASGNYFGKILLRDFFYKKMPTPIAKAFKNHYNLEVDVVKKNLYKLPNPNRYLASFASFMFEYKEEKYIQKIIKKGFRTYFKYHLLSYNKNSSTPIYFVGSIAFYFKDILAYVAQENNLTITDVIQRPIDNLVKYHQENTF
ncbi:N-acetylglucosamine kinase [Tenacibaculum sp. AHE15PA]|uniref:N-acetylglucosamine kinase n=1 Tax=unclassified Tenacibaculum TaxID=2635139 RepID=UPI001C4EB3CB|nr:MULTISPECIES: N-acetylglucosamine kinase [unclassified Tenacibaculum]QXP74520.1 N-acetylglucosamine kinase [Tenacibaculum sp. AHE14PA]QXP75110.1 N-acetylglucosamine kinase [Tenacibaculum sp. AHE15PA]